MDAEIVSNSEQKEAQFTANETVGQVRESNSKFRKNNGKKLSGGSCAQGLQSRENEDEGVGGEVDADRANQATSESRAANEIQNSSDKKKRFANQKFKNAGQQNSNNYRHNYNKTYSYNGQTMSAGIELDAPIFGLEATNKTSTTPKSGSKKKNLNHLLNFTYESAGKESNENYFEYERFAKQFWSTKLSKNSCFSKEQFLQANCQFVVKNNGDYSIHLAEPDLLVDWEKIEEVHLDTQDTHSCPICLYAPQAGKMTKCGHIYCWSCILHYLSLSDKTWRKCPICYESIYKKDLKSVKINNKLADFKPGDEIELNLMFKFKSKYNSITLPVQLYEQFLNDEKQSNAMSYDLFNSNAYREYKRYFKLQCKSTEYILDEVVRREREELERQLLAEIDQPEVCFVHEAIKLLEERESLLKSEVKYDPIEKKVNVPLKDEGLIVERLELQKQPELVYEDAFEDKITESLKIESEKQTHLEPTIETPPQQQQQPKQQQQAQLSSTNADTTYFYQSIDGQRIYINALNIRCLLGEYSAFERCPLKIKAKIVGCDSYFMSEENRKRFRYLAHLPLHSEFKIAELDLKEPVLSKQTLEMFKEEFEERRQFRLRKEKREKRHADKIAAIDAAAVVPHYSHASAMDEIKISDILLDYTNQFPEASSSPPVSSGVSIISNSSGNSNSSGYSSNDAQQSQQQQQQPISFAQMLRNPNGVSTKPAQISSSLSFAFNAWPTLDDKSTSPNLPKNSTNQLTTGWVNMAKLHQEQSSSLGRTKKCQDPPKPLSAAAKQTKDDAKLEMAENDESMPAPVYAKSFFSAIDESLKMVESKKTDATTKTSMTNNEAGLSEENCLNQTKEKHQKKKKKTKQLLFSTSLNTGF